MKNSIQLLKREEIDEQRWDQTIQQSPDGRLYATTSFLDCMAPGWNALVLGDYQYIMPLPVRRKAGITYIFQPAFSQQMGVFGSTPINQDINDTMLQELQKYFSYAEINMHSHHPPSKFTFSLRKNYLLPMLEDFETLQKKFSRSAHRNINKAIENDIAMVKHPDATELMKLHRQRYGNLLGTDEELEGLATYFRNCIQENTGHFFYAKNPQGYTIASSGYVQYKDRLVFLINGNLQEGLDTGASHLLKEYVIRIFSNKNLTMDFEGSDNPDFARFYEQYGAKDLDNYPFFIFNNLPIPMRWIKQRQIRNSTKQ